MPPPLDEGWISRLGEAPSDSRAVRMTAFEREVFAQGWRRIAGVDEAGRGPLAGPIVAAAVILGEAIEGLDDSKRLTAKRRESLFSELASGPHAIGVAMVEAGNIDAMGIQAANYAAMAEAAAALAPPPDFLLVDGYVIRGCALPQKRIIKGDARSWSIAAASIVAKVTRDRIMVSLHAAYPGYGFDRHKGYGTREHLDALERFGPCPAHRRSFAPVAKARQK